MAIDLGALSFGFYLTGSFAGFLYPIYLWVIVGNGLRFGVRYLFAAMAIAIVGLTTALISSDYWSQHIALGTGLIIGIIVLPMFYAVILRELEASNKELKKQIDVTAYAATHDSLTGLPNRFVFMDRLAQAIERSKRNKNRFAVLFIDLDRFNHINDTFGHVAGDEVLRNIASRLGGVLRGTDSAARLGSDEFVLLLNDLESRYNARQAGERITEIFSTPLGINGQELAVTASVGISIFPDDAEDVDTLIHYSDTAMYRAKKRGGNAFQSFSYIKETLT
jgi:diguanylate cyclase (GGDEF)-like protein